MLPVRTQYSADWFGKLSSEARDAMGNIKVTRKLTKGQILWRQGDKASEVARVESGCLKVVDQYSYGQDFFFSLVLEGECTGEVAAVSGLKHAYTLYAREETVLSVWDVEDLLLLNKQFPEICHQMMISTSRLTALICERLEHSVLLSIHERISLQLQVLLHSSGVKQADGSVQLQGVSHEDIANMLGCARPTVSRELKIMEEKGLLILSYGTVCATDLARLDDYCSSLSVERINE